MHSVDLGDQQQTACVPEALCREHEIDGVANNVGFVRLAKIGDMDLADLEDSLLLNLRLAGQIV